MAIPVQAVRHVNINCSQLESAQKFYENVVGLNTEAHTGPAPQDGTKLGMGPHMQWDAFMLNDHLSFHGTALDLLEWKTPLITGEPYQQPHHLGFSRLAFKVPEIALQCERLADSNVNCFSAPEDVLIDSDRDLRRRFFCFSGPDDMVLEFFDHDGPVEMGYVNVNCSNIERSFAWYCDNLGFQTSEPLLDHEMNGLVYGAAGSVHFESTLLHIPGEEHRFGVQLTEWTNPKPIGQPYTEMNNLGLYRIALAVDDCQACYEVLLQNGVNCPTTPVWLDMGPDLPIDGVWALFFFDPDGACIELIQNPELNA
ncbi:MAG: VOC family protein [Pseudomonadales bacterium]